MKPRCRFCLEEGNGARQRRVLMGVEMNKFVCTKCGRFYLVVDGKEYVLRGGNKRNESCA